MLPLRDDNPTLTTAREVMSPLVEELSDRPEVQAVYVLSSSAITDANPTRFDEESDFDVTIVLDIPLQPAEWCPRPVETYRLIADRIPSWVPPFLFYVPVPWGRMEVNINQLIYQYEADPRTVWNGEKCDTYANKSETVTDRDRAFQRLIHTKTRQGRRALEAERARLANRITWDVREMPLRQARRLGPEAGHHVINAALEEAIDCLYASHGMFVPNRKWKLAQLSTRGLITAEQREILHSVIRCDMTFEDLERRIHTLQRFCKSVGLHTDGPAAAEARAVYQAAIQLRPRADPTPYGTPEPPNRPNPPAGGYAAKPDQPPARQGPDP